MAIIYNLKNRNGPCSRVSQLQGDTVIYPSPLKVMQSSSQICEPSDLLLYHMLGNAYTAHLPLFYFAELDVTEESTVGPLARHSWSRSRQWHALPGAFGLVLHADRHQDRQQTPAYGITAAIWMGAVYSQLCAQRREWLH